MKIGESIRTIRKSIAMSQVELCNKTGISQTYLSLIERDKRKPSTEVLETISKAFDIPLPILFWFSLERNDISEHKREHYDFLKPSIDQLINSIFVQ